MANPSRGKVTLKSGVLRDLGCRLLLGPDIEETQRESIWMDQSAGSDRMNHLFLSLLKQDLETFGP
jgi:hypothetical protein